MGKEKKLEDIIPKETLDCILKNYHKIRDIEASDLKEYELLIKQLVKIDEILGKIADKGWLSVLIKLLVQQKKNESYWPV